jgi:hypothetical protein
MVKYYGRARQRIGSVNTNSPGQKMSGSGQNIGTKRSLLNYVKRRVRPVQSCRPPMQNGTIWRETFWHKSDGCKKPTSKCSAAAGGVGNIKKPYNRIPKSGENGC